MRNEQTGSITEQYDIAIRSPEQLEALLAFGRNFEKPFGRVTLNGDLFIDENAAPSGKETISLINCKELVLAVPSVNRISDHAFLEKVMEELIQSPKACGVLCTDPESLGFFKSKGYQGKFYGDHSLYIWNTEAFEVFSQMLDGACLPLELKGGEARALLSACSGNEFIWEKMIYGRIPLMTTANCVAKTTTGCLNKDGKNFQSFRMLTDRMGKVFPVLTDCRHCQNVIYNSVVMSLHKELEKWQGKVLLRLQFLNENKAQTEEILQFYIKEDGIGSFPFSEYTTGYEKRGVE